jgi:hypothetical protein
LLGDIIPQKRTNSKPARPADTSTQGENATLKAHDYMAAFAVPDK